MQEVASEIHHFQSLIRAEDRIAPLEEVFRLQGAEKLSSAEKRYLPRELGMPTAIVLAAGQGEELGELTHDRPKAMVQIGTKPLLAHIVAAYNGAGIKDIVVVRGYKKEAIGLLNVTYADNDDYGSTGELCSLLKGMSACRSSKHGLIVSYGDVLFRKYIVDLLRETAGDFVIIVDTEWRDSVNRNRIADYVRCSSAYSRKHYTRTVLVEQMGPDLEPGEIHGESTGFLKIAPAAVTIVSEVLQSIVSANNERANIPTLINELIARQYPVQAIYTSGNWCDIDSLEDIVSAGAF
jgi:phosphoenolpyruvate phosphomutase